MGVSLSPKLGFVGLLGLAGCLLEGPGFICASDADCSGLGRCEANAVCSTPDVGCVSERRYTMSAGDFAGVCVPGDPIPMEEDEDEPEEESAPCEEVFVDKFEADAVNTDLWDVIEDEARLVQGGGRIKFVVPDDASDLNFAQIDAKGALDLQDGQVLTKISEGPTGNLNLDIVVGGVDQLVGIFAYETYLVIFDSDSSEYADVDFAETPYIALDFDGEKATVLASADLPANVSDMTTLAAIRHGVNLSAVNFSISAYTPEGEPVSRQTASLGSVVLCAR